MKKHKGKIIAVAAVLLVLAVLFWWGGDAPGLQGMGYVPQQPQQTEQQPETEQPEAPRQNDAADTPALPQKPAAAEQSGTEPPVTPQVPAEQPEEPATQPEEPVQQDPYLTDSVPADKPQLQEPQDTAVTDDSFTCTLSVSCAGILEHMDWLDADKHELVPPDGVLLPPTQVTIYQGESVFNVLQRELKRSRIHLEFVNTPLYNTAYIEGIANLYEFDCGEFSGWMYSVNGWFPNYGSSRYILQPGDVVEWGYTCEAGQRVSDFYGEE